MKAQKKRPRGRPFAKGKDPRRNMSGLRRELREFHERFKLTLLGELLKPTRFEPKQEGKRQRTRLEVGCEKLAERFESGGDGDARRVVLEYLAGKVAQPIAGTVGVEPVHIVFDSIPRPKREKEKRDA